MATPASRRVALLALGLGALAAGCGGGTRVTGRVVYPAAVPVRAFPRIIVSGGHEALDRRFGDALAAHLRADATTEVRRLDGDDVDRARERGRIQPTSVVLTYQLSFSERTRPEMLTRPETVCGPLGCATRSRTRVYDIPVVRGSLTLVVHDGPTDRVLQRITVHAEEEGRDYELMRRRVQEALLQRAKTMVDQRTEEVEVEMLRVDLAGVEEAIESIRRGLWRRGRVRLEEAVEAPEFERLPDEQRARVLYDLGQARRFDPTTVDDVESHFRAAEDALRRAVRLDPEARYARALDDLREHRRQVEILRDQREARVHNFAISQAPPPPSVPTPPPGYGDP